MSLRDLCLKYGITFNKRLGQNLLLDDNIHAIMADAASLDPNEVGGTAMLGISKPVIKAHGSSDARAIYNAIRQAIAFADSGIIDDITANISYMRVDKHAAKESD